MHQNGYGLLNPPILFEFCELEDAVSIFLRLDQLDWPLGELRWKTLDPAFFLYRADYYSFNLLQYCVWKNLFDLAELFVQQEWISPFIHCTREYMRVGLLPWTWAIVLGRWKFVELFDKYEPESNWDGGAQLILIPPVHSGTDPEIRREVMAYFERHGVYCGDFNEVKDYIVFPDEINNLENPKWNSFDDDYLEKENSRPAYDSDDRGLSSDFETGIYAPRKKRFILDENVESEISEDVFGPEGFTDFLSDNDEDEECPDITLKNCGLIPKSQIEREISKFETVYHIAKEVGKSKVIETFGLKTMDIGKVVYVNKRKLSLDITETTRSFNYVRRKDFVFHRRIAKPFIMDCTMDYNLTMTWTPMAMMLLQHAAEEHAKEYLQGYERGISKYLRGDVFVMCQMFNDDEGNLNGISPENDDDSDYVDNEDDSESEEDDFDDYIPPRHKTIYDDPKEFSDEDLYVGDKFQDSDDETNIEFLTISLEEAKKKNDKWINEKDFLSMHSNNSCQDAKLVSNAMTQWQFQDYQDSINEKHIEEYGCDYL